YRNFSDRRPGREASELLASLLLVHEDPVLGPLGIFLQGQAFRELGMNDQMVALYEKALPQTHGPLARKMSLTLAEYYLTANQRDRARQLFNSLALVPGAKETAQAQLRLAEIALQEKHPDDCLKNCRRLLETSKGVDVPAILKLMGRAFEQ